MPKYAYTVDYKNMPFYAYILINVCFMLFPKSIHEILYML